MERALGGDFPEKWMIDLNLKQLDEHYDSIFSVEYTTFVCESIKFEQKLGKMTVYEVPSNFKPNLYYATNFAKCNLARAPARALLARNNVNLAEYQAWMQNAILVAGARLFDKKIFSDDTIHLRVVGPGFQKYDQYLDPNYAKSLEALDNCRKEGKKSANEARALGFNWLLLAILWCFCSLW
eukprot:gene8464-14452_t